MRVLLCPEKQFANLGDKSFLVEWDEVKKSAMSKDDIDIDEDIASFCRRFKDHAKAREYALKVVAKDSIAWGSATVTEEVVDWFEEEDRVAEWRRCGDPEEVCSGDLVVR